MLQREAPGMAAQPPGKLDRAGVLGRLIERAEHAHQLGKARMVEIVSHVERAIRPRDVADDMRVAAEQLHIGVDGGGLAIVLQAAAEAEGAVAAASSETIG